MTNRTRKNATVAAKSAGVLFCILALVICMTAYWLDLPEAVVQNSALLQPLLNLTLRSILPSDYNFLVAGYSSGLFFISIGILLIALSVPKKQVLINSLVQPGVLRSFKLLPMIWTALVFVVVLMFTMAVHAETVWSTAWLWFACLFLGAGLLCAWDTVNNRHFLHSREWLLVVASIVLVLALPKVGDMLGGRWVILVFGVVVFFAGPKVFPGQSGIARLLGLVMMAFFFYSYHYLNWRYSTIGDDMAHYGTAERIFQGTMPGTILSCHGTYSQHPLSAGYVQAAAMQLYGMDIYGWRMSETVAVLLAAFPFYYLARGLAGQRAGLLAAIVFLFSPHLMAFTRIGYNQCQGLVALLMPLACGILALKRHSLLGFFLTGVTLSLAFYTFGLVLPLMVLTPLLLLAQGSFFRKNNLKWTVLAALAALAGLLGAASPRIMDREWLYEMTVGMTSNHYLSLGEMLSSSETWWKTLHALTSFFSFGYPSQYMTGSLLSPPSAFLAALGIGCLLGSKRSIAWWLLAAWFWMAFVTGGLSPYEVPPNTRIFILVPVFALFAGIGFLSLSRWLPRTYRNGAAVLVSLAVIFLAYYQFEVLSPRKLWHNYYSTILRDVQEHPGLQKIWIVSGDSYNLEVAQWLLGGFRLDKTIAGYVSGENIRDGIESIKRGHQGPMKISVRLPRANAGEWGDAIRRQWPAASEELVTDPARNEVALTYTIPAAP